MHKIMIVDDDPSFTRYLEVFFQEHGYETCAACDTVNGESLLHQEKPDLITLDLEMPRHNSRFFHKILEGGEFGGIPVIVISGLHICYTIRKAVAHLEKPVNTKKLLTLVRQTIG